MFTSNHLHAMFIHFPIALLIVGFLAEVISLFSKKEFFKRAGFYLLLLGTLGTIASYFTGNAAGEGIEEGPLEKVIELHEQAAVITLWLTIITAIVYGIIFIFQYRQRWLKIISIILFAAVIGSIARTGYLGGQAVYKHGAGVQMSLPNFSNTDTETDE